MSLDGQSRTRDSGMTGIHENGSFISLGRELPQYFYNLWPFYSQSLLVLEVDNKSYVDAQHWLCTFLAISVPNLPNITKVLGHAITQFTPGWAVIFSRSENIIE